MPKYRYLILDVFTQVPFSGNQLAVFPDAADLTEDLMQSIAKELNLPETTFIYKPDHDESIAKIRIFTPSRELPLAGHPTIGSVFALSHEGIIESGTPSITVDMKIGPIPISMDWDAEQLETIWMNQPIPEYKEKILDPLPLVGLLGLGAEDIVVPNLPAQVVSSGVPFLFIPLQNRRAVDSISINRDALIDICKSINSPELPVYVFTLESHDDAFTYSRMFAPAFGIPEDPATGIASGPLGGYLLKYGLIDTQKPLRILNKQGVKMGRPGDIQIFIERNGTDITVLQVGGGAVIVGEGNLDLG